MSFQMNATSQDNSAAVTTDKALREKLSAVAVNTVSDTGFLFEVGNAMIGFTASPEAGAISLCVSSLCFAARTTGEAKKIGLTFGDVAEGAGRRLPATFRQAAMLPDSFKNTLSTVARPLVKPLGRVVERMSGNLGTSLMISGSALMVAAGFAASHGFDMASLHDFYTSTKEGLILGCFGAANAFRGIARGLTPGGVSQRMLDVMGIGLASTGVIIAGQDIDTDAVLAFDPQALVDTAIKGSFVGAAGLAAYEAVKGVSFKSLARPDIIFAGGCLGNAVMNGVNGSPWLGAANALFGIAFLSLDALKNAGGVYEQCIAPALAKKEEKPSALDI